MFDLHTHLLPAVDDGVASPDEALEIAEMAARDGVRLLAATPHVRDDYPTAVATMAQGVAAIRERLDAEGLQVEIATGAEVDLTYLWTLSDEDLRAFGLAGNPDYILVEFPYYGWPRSLDSTVLSLRRRGITAVLAHPERNPAVQDRPELLGDAVKAGALLQVTCHSLVGGFGKAAEKAALRLIDSGWPCLLASDKHLPDDGRASLKDAAQDIDDESLTEWLTVRMPAAIVFGGTLPSRPQGRAQRRRFIAVRRRRTITT